MIRLKIQKMHNCMVFATIETGEPRLMADVTFAYFPNMPEGVAKWQMAPIQTPVGRFDFPDSVVEDLAVRFLSQFWPELVPSNVIQLGVTKIMLPDSELMAVIKGGLPE